jgi:hypothetical protein
MFNHFNRKAENGRLMHGVAKSEDYIPMFVVSLEESNQEEALVPLQYCNAILLDATKRHSSLLLLITQYL